jgi:sec-independent protein translocase protein TatB
MSFGLTFDKLIIIAVIAVFLIGPDRLPGYAAQLARVVRSLRSMADGAKDRMREEMGPEFDEVDWKKLDPRQYDPRRIIREALLEDPVSAASPTAVAAAVTAVTDIEGGTEGETEGGTEREKPKSAELPVRRYVESAYEERQRRLGKGRPAPYDIEAT